MGTASHAAFCYASCWRLCACKYFLPTRTSMKRIATTLIAITAAGASLLSACDENDVTSDPVSVTRDDQGYEVDPEGQWLTGDVHVHATGASNDTGGDSTLPAIKSTAIERGLDFVVLTDHSNSTGSDPSTRDEDPELYNQGPEFVFWDEAAALSDAGSFILVSGNEISPVQALISPTEPRGHIGCIPRTLGDDFDTDSRFTDRPPGDVTGGDSLAEARDRGCFTVVNHPYSTFAVHIAYDWTDLGYDAIEVWNGTASLDSDDTDNYNAWRCDLLAGRQVTPIAGSDNHRVNIEPPGDLTNPPLGHPATAVFASDFSWPAIVSALDDGNVALVEGDSMLTLDGYDSDKRRATGSEIRIFRMRGALDTRAAQDATLRLIRATGCDDPRPATDKRPEITDEVLQEWTVSPGDSFDHDIVINASTGVYTATLLTKEPVYTQPAQYSALSRAIIVE